jgi:hypothetical protein
VELGCAGMVNTAVGCGSESLLTRILPFNSRLSEHRNGFDLNHLDCEAFQPSSPMNATPSGFRGNKAALPSKPCLACGRPMSWRRRWARTWDEVKYCSDACRRAKGQAAHG